MTLAGVESPFPCVEMPFPNVEMIFPSVEFMPAAVEITFAYAKSFPARVEFISATAE
jgi:hypothetical protein